LKITGSNPSLKNRRVELNPIFPYSALLAARKNIFLDKEKPSGLRESSSTVPLYHSARTFFSKNS
jgi:hypothetical protein